MKLKTKFQDENFELGEVVETKVTASYDENRIVVTADMPRDDGTSSFAYNSVKDFTDHWEDAPEEKHYFIDNAGNVKDEKGHSRYRKQRQEIGNDFASEEETMRAAEKLKAWQRLKEKGFRFTGIAGISNNIYVSFETDSKYRGGHVMYDEYSNTDNNLREYNEDLMLLFGGEE